jgi:phenylacetate-CoA ligase
MRLVRRLRAATLQAKVAAADQAHSEPLDPQQRRKRQLKLFNLQWTVIRQTVPYYRDLADSRRLPEQFASWHEVIDTLPVANRDFVKEHGARLFSEAAQPEWKRVTGGSTAQPLQLPAWNSETALTSADQWLGRSWYGVRPDDRVFLLWGHRHLLGKGWRARFKGLQRQIRDRLLDLCRFSAYDLSPQNLRRAGETILSFRPAYLLGYSVALDMLARANADRASEFHRLGLKAVIGTAEGFPSTDSEEVVTQVFGAPAAMEYGAVETGVMAYTRPTGRYEAFWHTNFIEATEPGGNGGRIVRIISLYPRCFPLLRYELGDEVELSPGDDGIGLFRFTRVLGRCNAYLVISDGTKIHSEAITHCVSSFGEIHAYQAVQEGPTIRLLVRSASPLTPETLDTIQMRLGRIHPALRQIRVERVEALRQSVAGKTPMIIRS